MAAKRIPAMTEVFLHNNKRTYKKTLKFKKTLAQTNLFINIRNKENSQKDFINLISNRQVKERTELNAALFSVSKYENVFSEKRKLKYH